MTKTAALYVRQSKADDEGIERQIERTTALAQARGWAVAATYVDNDVTASKPRGPQTAWGRMLAASASLDVVIAVDLDRIARSTRDLNVLIDHGLALTTVDGEIDLSTADGEFRASMLASIARFETRRKGERQTRANQQRALKGGWHFSRRPYGYRRVNGRIEIVPEEAAIVREGFARYLDGVTYYELANDWNARGVPTLGDGTAWSMSRVRSMLRNERYAGLTSYKGERIEPARLDWEPLIDRKTWDAYLRMRDGRKRSGSWSTAAKHLLSGLIYCGECGGRMLARPDRGRQVYACTSGWCVSRGAADVERLVVGVVLGRLADPKVIAHLRDAPDTAPLEAELADLRAARSDLAQALRERVLTLADVREQSAILDAQIAPLERRLDALRAGSPLTDLALAASIPARWDELPLVTKRQVIQEIGIDVRIDKGTPGRRPFDPDTVQIIWR